MNSQENVERPEHDCNLALDLGWPPLPWEPADSDHYGSAGVLLTFAPHPACACADCDTEGCS